MTKQKLTDRLEHLNPDAGGSLEPESVENFHVRTVEKTKKGYTPIQATANDFVGIQIGTAQAPAWSFSNTVSQVDYVKIPVTYFVDDKQEKIVFKLGNNWIRFNVSQEDEYWKFDRVKGQWKYEHPNGNYLIEGIDHEISANQEGIGPQRPLTMLRQ